MNDNREVHRYRVYCTTVKEWYAVMNECRRWFGTEWKGQGRVGRKLKANFASIEIPIWFDVPDPRWATWIVTKFALRVVSEDKYKPGK